MFESTRELATNKLILLFLLEKINMPLSNTQITQFILERNYTDYFSVQQYLIELVEARLLEQKEDGHTTRYSITDQGSQTLKYFSTHISQSAREDIILFSEKNRRQLKKEIEITAEYIPEKKNEYLVYCCVKENDTLLIDLKVNVVSKDQAKMICENWKKNAQILYGKILNNLTNAQ